MASRSCVDMRVRVDRLFLNLHVGGYEIGSHLRHYCISVGAQLPHSALYPMSQRTNSGFNAPRFSVGAGDESEPGAPPVTTCWLNGTPVSRGKLPLIPSCAVGVAQPANCTAIPSVIPKPFPFIPFFFIRSRRSCHFVSVSFHSPESGVGQPEQPLPDVRRACARSAQICSPAGISCCFHVSTYSSEPFTSKRACNLLSKDRWRSALGDEAVKSGPDMALIGMAFSLSSARKRLTGTGAGPDGSICGPAGEGEGEAPAADAGEKVALLVLFKLVWLDVLDWSCIDFPFRQLAGAYEVFQPRDDV